MKEDKVMSGITMYKKEAIVVYRTSRKIVP